MPKKTTNIGLNLLEETDNPFFEDWCKEMNGADGENRSNMEIIDEAIGDLSPNFETSSSTIIEWTLQKDTDITFEEEVTAINLTIPADIKQGFICTINSIIGATAATFKVVNLSALPIMYIDKGLAAASITIDANTIRRFFIECDGLRIYIFSQELRR